MSIHFNQTISSHKYLRRYHPSVPVVSNTIPDSLQSQISIPVYLPRSLTGPVPHTDRNVSPSSNHQSVCVCVCFRACVRYAATELGAVFLQACEEIAADCLPRPRRTFKEKGGEEAKNGGETKHRQQREENVAQGERRRKKRRRKHTRKAFQMEIRGRCTERKKEKEAGNKSQESGREAMQERKGRGERASGTQTRNFEKRTAEQRE